MAIDYRSPVLLQPFNAVPLTRTPWAGQGIHALLGNTEAQDSPRLGECWEFSCDPQYPSRLAATHTRLDTAIAANPCAALSERQVAQHGSYCQLLVKLINAERALSVQLHPELSDDAPLAGKWESWLVLAAPADSKAYVGFTTALSRSQLRTEINSGNLAKHLATIVLRQGTCIEIPPRTVHALGAGAVLLEVQYLLRGRGGETLRLWDWGHRYDEEGELDPQHGKARPLALARALPLIDSEAQRQELLYPRILPTAQKYYSSDTLAISRRSNNPYYCLLTISATQHSTFGISVDDGYGIMLCWRGTWQLGDIKIDSYQPLFLPAKLGKLTLVCEKHSDAVLIIPAGAKLNCLP